jgi:hypothetical protein
VCFFAAYSARNAIIGEIREARNAGMRPAAPATSNNTAAAPA